MLRLSRLSVRFADRVVVGNVVLAVGPGEAVGLIGGSGSGKTLTALAVLVADEPVSALDATVRVKVLDLLRTVSEDAGAALVMVSHDVATVRRVCTRVAVLHRGWIAESGTVSGVFGEPGAQATRELLAAVPHLPVRAR